MWAPIVVEVNGERVHDDVVVPDARVLLEQTARDLDRAALYFEIRHQGKPTDPARWCRG